MTAECELQRRLRLRRIHSFGTRPMLFHRCLRVAAIVTILLLITFIRDFFVRDALQEVKWKNETIVLATAIPTIATTELLTTTPTTVPIRENLNQPSTSSSLSKHKQKQKQKQNQKFNNTRTINAFNQSILNNNNNNTSTILVKAKIPYNKTLRGNVTEPRKKQEHTILPLNQSSFTETHFHLPAMLHDDPDHHQSQEQRDLFLAKYCHLEGTDWFPPDDSWQWRAPAAVIAGTHAAGIPGIVQAMHVSEAKQNRNFFFHKHFAKFLTRKGKVKVWSARQRLWNRNYKALKVSKDLITIDATEGYLFHSTTVPVRLLCTCPWIKLVIVLRNPVDRVWGHYQEFKTHHNLRIPLEEWIANDVMLLQDVGLLPGNGSKQKQFDLAPDEDDAYALYMQFVKEGPVGQGLYEIQLRHWLAALQALGRDLNTSVLILRYEEWKSNPQGVLQHIIDFLGLPSRDTVIRNLQLVDQSLASKVMDPETRAQLETIYAPFNKKLYQMLGWQEVWKGESDQ